MTEYPYPSVALRWERLDIQMADLGPRLMMSEFSQKFRSKDPRLLVYEAHQLGWRGFVACAPWNTALAALDVFGRILSPSLIRWGQRIINDLATYKRFESAIRQASIRKDDVPKTLFWPYAGFGAYVNGAKRSFGTKSPSIDYLRVSGWLISAERSADFELFLDEIIRAAGEWAFCRAEEGAKTAGRDRSFLSDSPSLLGAPLALQDETSSIRVSRLMKLLSDLSMAIEGLSVRAQHEFDASYHEIVRPRVDLFANASGFGQESSFDKLTEEVIIKKIALAQELGWPTFYSSFADSLKCFERPGHFDSARYDEVRGALREALTELRVRHDWIGKAEKLAESMGSDQSIGADSIDSRRLLT